MTPEQSNFLRWISFDEEKPPQDGTPFLVYVVPASHVDGDALRFMREMDALYKGQSTYKIVWMGRDGRYQPWSNDMMHTWSHWARLEPPK